MISTIGIAALLLDTDGVLYHRPRREHKLGSFLDVHGYKLLDPLVVKRALRAARLDVHSGRISREMYFDAILRVHNVYHPSLLALGRKVLFSEAADIELFPHVAETLNNLQSAGFRLGTLSSTPHASQEKITWLARHGLSPELWSAFVSSPELRQVAMPGMLLERALEQLDLPAHRVAFVGHDTDELLEAADLGLLTIAFRADDPEVEAHLSIDMFSDLADVFLQETTGR